jgi:ABC-type nitrate/sulfonate/bicarbonate transport system substrate-binding protein
MDNVRKNSQAALGVVASLHRTMNYMLHPANRAEVVQYVSNYHKIDSSLAAKAFTAQIPAYSKDGTKPRQAVEREIEIYRETLKIAKPFTPDDLEDMSLLKKVQNAPAAPSR